MSRKQRTPTKRPTTTAAPDLLVTVEGICARAGGVMRATARVVSGEELGLQHEDAPGVYAAALEHVAGELEGLSDRALKARTGGAA